MGPWGPGTGPLGTPGTLGPWDTGTLGPWDQASWDPRDTGTGPLGPGTGPLGTPGTPGASRGSRESISPGAQYVFLDIDKQKYNYSLPHILRILAWSSSPLLLFPLLSSAPVNMYLNMFLDICWYRPLLIVWFLVWAWSFTWRTSGAPCLQRYRFNSWSHAGQLLSRCPSQSRCSSISKESNSFAVIIAVCSLSKVVVSWPGSLCSLNTRILATSGRSKKLCRRSSAALRRVGFSMKRYLPVLPSVAWAQRSTVNNARGWLGGRVGPGAGLGGGASPWGHPSGPA